MKREIDCPAGGRADTAALYLAGRLSDAQAEAFEEHYFACAECREDVRAGSELRETLRKPAIAIAAPERPSRRTWLPLAAAAAIAFVGIGVWHLSRRPESEKTVSRGAEGSIAGLAVSARADGGLDVTWATPPGAASYEVQVFSPDGRRLWRMETRETRVHIEPAAFEPGAHELRVDAFDSIGRMIASAEIPVETPAK